MTDNAHDLWEKRLEDLLRVLRPLISLILFVFALGVLWHALKEYQYEDVLHTLQVFPLSRLFLSGVLTALSYLLLTGYDKLALCYIQHSLAYRKIALASFIGYAFSNNLGLSLLVSGSVRYRLYSAWGLSTVEIAQVLAFNSFTLWLGFFTVGGVIFLFAPLRVPLSVHLPFLSVRPLGICSLLLVGGYMSWIAFRKKPLQLWRWKFSLPSLKLALSQIVVASLDWCVAGSVLYTLLPPTSSLTYPGFLSIFLLAQIVGLVSQIPGGLGVFETVILLFLSPILPASTILGSLVLYRIVYYLFPLGIALVLLGFYEIFQDKKKEESVEDRLNQGISSLLPSIFAFIAVVNGAVLLFFEALPLGKRYEEWLGDILPLSLLEISHFLGSLVGMGLLLLARGLQHRLDTAYILTVGLLSTGVVVSLLKGLDYERAIVLAIILTALLPCRRHFYRKASLMSQRFTLSWTVTILMVLLGSVWLGMFSYKHVQYANELWWHFSFSGDAPRFLRATVGAVSMALIFGFIRLLHPALPKPQSLSRTEWDRVRAVVAQSPKTAANLALLGDKTFLFSETGNAFIMYGIKGRSWIAMGDPVGPKEEGAELLWRFRELCDQYDGWPVFYEVGTEYLSFYLDLGLTLLKLGEEARVLLSTFSLEGRTRKSFRHLSHRLEREGWAFEVIPPTKVRSRLSELQQISDAWLAQKHTGEKGFSLGRFDAEYLQQFPAGIVRRREKVVAFANLWLGAGKEELSPDLMRYLPDAPPNVMEYLFIQLMLWGKQEGYRWFNLGMAPLSGLENNPLSPLWSRIGTFIFRHGEHFYNFQGLREYKEKFSPVWEPKYLASPGRFSLPHILIDIASHISGGFKEILTK